MDIDAAIQSHVQWKITLRKLLAQDIKPEKDPRNDRACSVGQWLGSGNGTKDIDAAHREFHLAAAKVIDLAAKDKAAAQVVLDGEFGQKSMRLVTLLGQLRDARAA